MGFGDIAREEIAKAGAELMQTGVGGRIEVIVRLERGLRGEIVAESVAGAVARVIQEIPQQGTMSNAIKGLVS